jgi:hypothetical protein
MNARQKDPTKEAALWAAIRALDGGTRRDVDERAGKPSDRGSWHEKDARRILFLKHRYDAGEWQGEADQAAAGAESSLAALLGQRARS